MTGSGAAAGKLPKCKLFDQLLFLRDSVCNRQSKSNVTIEKSEVPDTEAFTPPASPLDDSKTRKKQSSTEKCNFPSKKSRKQLSDECDAVLIDALKNTGPSTKDIVDPDVSFTESIIHILRSLPRKKKQNGKARNSAIDPKI